MIEEAAIPTRVLVLGMQRPDGTIAASAVYDVAQAAGLSGQQVRLCFRRLVTEGRFAQEGRGRAAVFRPLDDQAAELPELELLNFAYQQDAGQAPWDGHWHLVGFNIPERARSARDAFRNHLVLLGGALVHGGLYVSANQWEDLVEEQARQLQILLSLTMIRTPSLSVGGLDEPLDLAAHLWPLAEIDRDYRRFLDTLERMVTRATDGHLADDTLPAVFRTVLEFSAVAARDPLLPPELLPEGWSGRRARSALKAAADELRTQADTAALPAVVRLLTEPAPRHSIRT